jgi:leucyl aminopeptidase (aminopeptidase T)
MAFLIGTEMRDDYLTFEVARAARKAVEEVHPVQPGENVVITCDTAGDSRVVNAIAQAVYALGAHPVVVWYETQPDAQMEPPAPVAAALAAADVWFEFGVQYILYTEARIAATKAGCRHACYGGMDVEMLVRTIGQVDYPVMTELGQKLRELCMAANEVRISDPNGTDLRCPVDPNPPVYLPGAGQPGQGFSRMLGGQSGFSAQVEQINGTIVFDGALWPPAEIGPLDAPVTLTVEDGYVTAIAGGPQARIFERWMARFDNRQMYRIAHLSFGFNPGVTRITGRIVEDERVFGCLDIGIGPQALGAPSHTDGIILRPSLVADGVEIEREGIYVHPELAALCRTLGVA